MNCTIYYLNSTSSNRQYPQKDKVFVVKMHDDDQGDDDDDDDENDDEDNLRRTRGRGGE